MEIRIAVLEDLKEIIRLNKIVDYWNPDSYIRESIQSWNVFVICDDDTILGFLLYQEIWGNTTFLTLIKILPNYYNRWLGTQLLSYFENILLSRGISSYVSSTTSDNDWAQNFHLKNGFQNIWTLNMNHGWEVFYRKELG